MDLKELTYMNDIIKQFKLRVKPMGDRTLSVEKMIIGITDDLKDFGWDMDRLALIHIIGVLKYHYDLDIDMYEVSRIIQKVGLMRNYWERSNTIPNGKI